MWTKLFDLGICFFEGYMYYTLWSHFLKLRVEKKWFPFVLVVPVMVIIFYVNQFRLSTLNLLISIISSIIMCSLLFVDSFKKKLFYALLSSFVMLCCEFIMVGVFNLPLSSRALSYENEPLRVILIVISSKLFSFMVYRWICQASKSGKKLFFASLVPYFSTFPIACLILYTGIAYSSIDFNYIEFSTVIILVGCILLLLANIVLFIVYDRMTFMMNRVKEYEVTDFKRQLENQHYLQIEEINRKHSEIIHDMGNYMKTIETLALKENNEKIVDIVESLNRHIIKIGEEHYCNHQIINAILNGKKQEALNARVEYNVYVEIGFRKPDVEDIDLISIISNLIDNSIEAASKCENGYTNIKMYKANDGRFTTIKITNNYKEEPLEKGGEFISRKKNPLMHGIGIRHVKSIVERYGGWTNIEYGDNIFSVTIMFA